MTDSEASAPGEHVDGEYPALGGVMIAGHTFLDGVRYPEERPKTLWAHMLEMIGIYGHGRARCKSSNS